MKEDLLLQFRLGLRSHTPQEMQAYFAAFEAGRAALVELVQSGGTEHELQHLLEAHPAVLVHAALDGFYPVASRRSCLFPKVKLGLEHETDFAYCSANSLGEWWTFIELERADVELFNKAGDPSKHLTHALRQVTDWQAWMRDNPDYAERALAHLTTEFHAWFGWGQTIRRPANCLVIIGRRHMLTPETNRRRAELCTQFTGLQVVTWDRLCDDYRIDKQEPLDAGKDEVRTIREIPGE